MTTQDALMDRSAATQDFAGFWLRLAAGVIDSFIVGIAGALFYFFLAFVVGMVLAIGGAGQEMAVFVDILIGKILVHIIYWLYFAIQHSSSAQATLGMRALGMAIVDEDGERITFGRATGRYFASYLSAIILMIGYLMIAFTARKQALHDMIAKTLVVRV